ncbi:MAG: type II secretion system protein GspG [Pseudomonadota bacterium]
MALLARKRKTGISSKWGFTLIELIIVLAVIAIMSALIIPLGYQQITSSRERAARTEIENIYQAIMGKPQEGNYGYLADVGSLPSSLDDLLAKPAAVSSYSTTTGGQPNKNLVGRGWRGPYLNTQDNEIVDGWGHKYRYGPPDGAGQIRSAGSDGIFGNADDILFPQNAVNHQGTLLVAVFVNGIPNPLDTTVTVYSTINGQQNVGATISRNDAGFNGFIFTVPQGIQVAQVTQTSNVKASGGETTPVSVTKLVNAEVPANKQINLGVYLTNSEPVVP